MCVCVCARLLPLMLIFAVAETIKSARILKLLTRLVFFAALLQVFYVNALC